MATQVATAGAFDPSKDGWVSMEDEGFISLVGPVFEKSVDGESLFSFVSQPKHKNLRGVTQGGMMMTFADRTMGATARSATGQMPQATVQLNYQFLDAVKLGDFVVAKCSVLRRTKSLVFVDAKILVGEHCVGAAQGVWKILAPRQSPEAGVR